MKAQPNREQNPFRIDDLIQSSFSPRIERGISWLIESSSGLKKMQRYYRQFPAFDAPEPFLSHLLATLQIRYRVDQSINRIPATGPLVIVANHPFGGLDGVLLAHHLLQQRRDVRFMANYFLGRIPELSDLFIQVDPFNTESATRSNIAPLKRSLEWLKAGGVLVVFPAGEVSHISPGIRRIADPKWKKSVARLIRRAEVPVIPAYIHGRNSLFFQSLGLLHPALRTLLLPRELINKKRGYFHIRLGATIAPGSMARFGKNSALIEHLRLQTYSLKTPQRSERGNGSRLHPDSFEPVLKATKSARIQHELDHLPPGRHLLDSGDFRVYCARAGEIPSTLREIGRQREITFRAAGEGTGRPIDLDDFDRAYWQLFIWDTNKHRLVGGYRLGLVDELLDQRGLRGLYTYSLFKYRKRLLNRFGPSIELGRSFVTMPYQKSYAPLMLLWKGIGAFVAARPHYITLFGPVSISGEYQQFSQQLMVDFLRQNHFDSSEAKGVKPRRRFKPGRRAWSRADIDYLDSLDMLSDAVSMHENDQKGVPVLLRQYLKLGGQLLGFNIDRDFNNALDGLIRVDLTQTDERTLLRYMGREAGRAYIEFHRTMAKAA